MKNNSGKIIYTRYDSEKFESGEIENFGEYILQNEDAMRYMCRQSYPHIYNVKAEHYGLPELEYSIIEYFVDNANVAVEYLLRNLRNMQGAFRAQCVFEKAIDNPFSANHVSEAKIRQTLYKTL